MKNKEKMIVPKLRFNEFKDNWKQVKINDLLTIGNGKDYKHLSKGNIPVYGSGGLMTYVDDFLYDGESACIGRKGTIDSPMYLDGKFWTVDTLFYTHSFINSTPKFIYSIFQNINWLKYNEAGGVPSLSKTTIQKINVAVPDIPEQQKIADCLTSLDELITAESKKLKLLQDHKKGLMQNLFPAEGKTMPEWRFPEFRDSEEWIRDTLLSIANFRRGSFPQPYGLPKWYDKDGFPFIQVFDVDENFRLKSETKNKISKLATEQSVFIPQNTVIITIQGSIGRVAITQYDAYIDRTLLLFESFNTTVNKIFFAYSLKLLFDIEKQKAPGGIIKTITKEVLSSFIISIPTDEREQQKIADCLSSVDNFISEQSSKIEQLKEHKKGLMQGLFPSVEEVE